MADTRVRSRSSTVSVARRAPECLDEHVCLTVGPVGRHPALWRCGGKDRSDGRRSRCPARDRGRCRRCRRAHTCRTRAAVLSPGRQAPIGRGRTVCGPTSHLPGDGQVPRPEGSRIMTTTSTTVDTIRGASTVVRAATADDTEAISVALAGAFTDDPVFSWCIPDRSRRSGSCRAASRCSRRPTSHWAPAR